MKAFLGYVARNKSVASFESGLWTPSLDQLECTEGVVLITGGLKRVSGKQSRMSQVEIWGPNGLSRSLSNLSEASASHTTFYIDGHVILCGTFGRDGKDCLIGEFHPASKGKNDGVILSQAD